MLTLVQAPMENVIELAFAKQRLRIDTSADDEVVVNLIATATTYLDGANGILGRALMPQSWRYDLGQFPDAAGWIELPLPPLLSVEQIQYRDSAGSVQTLASTVYRAISTGDYIKPRLMLDVNQSWPTTETGVPDAVQVTYTAGYQDLVSPANNPVPEPIQQAILLIAQTLYDNPGSEFPEAVWTLIAPYRVNRLGGVYG
jgi:uncharacterized phiE125 gp8 family phage protein